MNLDDLISSNRGRPPSLTMTYVRPLGLADVPFIKNPRTGHVVPAGQPLLQIRARHHSAARMIAEGLSLAQISGITGYTPARISTLKQSPDFVNLVSMYREQKDAVFIDVHEKKAELAVMVVDELKDRLEDGKVFTNTELRELLKALNDPNTKPAGPPSVSVSVSFVDSGFGAGQTIQGTVVENKSE